MSTVIPFRREFVCIGTRTDAKGKAFLSLLPLDDAGKATDRPLYFGQRKGVRLAVGHVYVMNGNAAPDESTMSLVLSSAEWVREYPDQGKVATWQAEALAARRTAEVKSIEKREATNTSALEDILEPLQRAYQRLPINQRPAFETWVLMTLRRIK